MDGITRIPVRTGIATVRKMLRALCSMIVRFLPLWNVILSPSQLATVQPLLDACDNFLKEVPVPVAGDPLP